MMMSIHPYSHSSRPGWRWLAAIAAVAMILTLWANAAAADEQNLQIELNKTEDSGGGCLASFVVENKLGHTLDRFSLDLFVFDKEGIIARQVLLDMAPLRKSKTTVANFALVQVSCDSIGKVLVNDIPSCRSEDGSLLDCLTDLKVSSRNRIELTK
jgi:hypothetical protein